MDKFGPQFKSIFTQGSCEETNAAFRQNPFLGAHKHGLACAGHVRAVVFPLSSRARECCRAEWKEQGDSSQVVRLAQCEESTYFAIATLLTANVTVRTFDDQADDDAVWEHPVEARIYPDPEGPDAELFNNSYIDTITANSYPPKFRFVLGPGQHCRLDANYTWALDVRYRFGLILHPVPAPVFTPLLDDGKFPSLARVHEAFRHTHLSNAEPQPATRPCAPDEDDSLSEQKVDRRISMPPSRKHSPPPSNATVQDEMGSRDDPNLAPSLQHVKPAAPVRVRTLFEDEPSIQESFAPLSPCPSSQASHSSTLIFRDHKTLVYVFERHAQKRVRKILRSQTLHKAAMQWERELVISKSLSHPHIIKPMAWSCSKRTIDFPHAGADLSTFKNASNYFSLGSTSASSLATIQRRILSQMAQALKYLHAHDITHRDVKPHNILLSPSSCTATLIDFGNAHYGPKWCGGGTEWYIPPEVLTAKTSGERADVWALGITMLFILGLVPLPASEAGMERWEIGKLVKEEGEAERNKMWRWLKTVRQAKAGIEEGGEWGVVRNMLAEIPEERISAAELVDRLAVEQEEENHVAQGEVEGISVECRKLLRRHVGEEHYTNVYDRDSSLCRCYFFMNKLEKAFYMMQLPHQCQKLGTVRPPAQMQGQLYYAKTISEELRGILQAQAEGHVVFQAANDRIRTLREQQKFAHASSARAKRLLEVNSWIVMSLGECGEKWQDMTNTRSETIDRVKSLLDEAYRWLEE
ncbi:hypothetical protein ACEQ8H_008400 [Pleosporales sp. CAS-2024a]